MEGVEGKKQGEVGRDRGGSGAPKERRRKAEDLWREKGCQVTRGEEVRKKREKL